MRLLPSIALGLCCLSASAQRFTVLLDPARGGTEDGAHIDEHTTEKQVTLDVANRLRALLNARDFNVVMTRETDMLVTNDARAAVANQARPVACLLLHATAAGRGLHLFTSALPQMAPQTVAVPWDEAQAPFADRSQRLESELSTAFGRSKIAVSSGRTWVRPLDNMQCPAVAIEIAPDAEGATSADHGYQNRIAETIAGALLFWRGHGDVMQSILAPVEVKSTAPTNLVAEPGKTAAAAKPGPSSGVPATTRPAKAAGGGASAGTTPAGVVPSAPKIKSSLPTAGTLPHAGMPATKAVGPAGVAAKPLTTGVPAARTGLPGAKAPTAATKPPVPHGTPLGTADPNAIAPVKVPRLKPVPVRPAEGSSPQ